MSDTEFPNQALPEDTQATPEKEPEKPAKTGRGLALLALLVSLVAAAVAVWTWQQGEADSGAREQRTLTELARLRSANSELELKITQLRDGVDALAASDTGEEFSALQSRWQSDRQRIAKLENEFEQQLRLTRNLQTAAEAMQARLLAAEASVTGLSSRELDAGSELDLDEVDYLLRLANERLKLFSDPQAADDALEVADMHLAAIDNPMYLGVRQEIAKARRELAATEVPQLLTIARQLDDLQQSVADLQFPEPTSVMASTATEADESWWARLKSSLSGLVTVRRNTDQAADRISLEDKDLIRQRLWLQMEIAHLALMRQDQQAFRHALERSSESVDHWFDPEQGSAAEVKAGLDELMELQIVLDVPDITAPWSALRTIRSGVSRTVPDITVDEETSEGDS